MIKYKIFFDVKIFKNFSLNWLNLTPKNGITRHGLNLTRLIILQKRLITIAFRPKTLLIRLRKRPKIKIPSWKKQSGD